MAVPSQVALTQWETDAEFSVGTCHLEFESVEGPHEFKLCGDISDKIGSANFSSSFLDGFKQDLEDEQTSVNFAKAAHRKRSRLQIVSGSQAPTEAMSESRDSSASPQDFVGLMAVEVASNQRGLSLGRFAVLSDDRHDVPQDPTSSDTESVDEAGNPDRQVSDTEDEQESPSVISGLVEEFEVVEEDVVVPRVVQAATREGFRVLDEVNLVHEFSRRAVVMQNNSILHQGPVPKCDAHVFGRDDG